MRRRSWVEINLETIANNYKIFDSIIGSNREVMAVVKADAYGHGDIQVSKKLQEIGCKNFAVSNIDEGIGLRKAGINGMILVLGYTPASAAKELIEHDITGTLISSEYAEDLKDYCEKNKIDSKKLKMHFAIDTGMNRIGLDGDDANLCERKIRKYAEAFNVTGIFTHLCVADTPSESEFTASQISKFEVIADRVKDLEMPFVHYMNSAAGLWTNDFSTHARLGIVLHGLKPDPENILPEEIKPALAWKSVISMVKDLHKGETIGYGRRFKAEKEMRVATIPTGYADGYSRLLSMKGHVYIAGKRANILGGVCMDQFMVDVTDIPEAKFETEVDLIGENYGADDMARDIGTIGYEVVCDISKRVPRVYI